MINSHRRRIREKHSSFPEFHPGWNGISIIHAENNYDIPWTHSDDLFWHAVNASLTGGIASEELEKEKVAGRVDRGDWGWMYERRGPRGWIREEIVKYGLHDRIISYPVVSQAVARAFGDSLNR